MVLAGGAFRAMAGINRWLCSVYIGRDLTVFEVRNEEMNTSAVKHRQGGLVSGCTPSLTKIWDDIAGSDL
jgi:hypothetical protein